MGLLAILIFFLLITTQCVGLFVTWFSRTEHKVEGDRTQSLAFRHCLKIRNFPGLLFPESTEEPFRRKESEKEERHSSEEEVVGDQRLERVRKQASKPQR